MIGLLTAILLILAFPQFNLTFLAPFALVPLFIFTGREKRPWRRFWIGYATGVVYWFGMNYWIQSTLAQHGGMGVAESWALFLLFCLAKAIQMGLFAWLAGYIRPGWWAAPCLARSGPFSNGRTITRALRGWFWGTPQSIGR